jgi:hypothetical protein
MGIHQGEHLGYQQDTNTTTILPQSDIAPPAQVYNRMPK